MALATAHGRAWLLLVCLAAAVGPGESAAHENARRWGRRHRPSGARGACFVTHHRGGLSSREPLERSNGVMQSSNIDRRRWRVAALRNSVGNGDEADDTSVEPSADASPNSNSDDPDGTPLFDTYERATLFGLEPKAELDPLDNGLQFTGPIILLASIYVTLALFFADEGPPLDF